MGVTGKDDVRFILGVKNLVNDHVRDIDSLSCPVTFEEVESVFDAFSVSVLAPRFLNFCRRLLADNRPLFDTEPGDPLGLGFEVLLGVWKLTLLGVGVGVGGIFI